MGIDIDISTHQSEVFAGEVVQGSVAVTVGNSNGTSAGDLGLQLTGKTHTLVMHRVFVSLGQGGTTTYTQPMSQSKTFLEHEVVLGNFAGRADCGTHTFPFAVVLPPNLPSTIKEKNCEGSTCSIEYELRARLHRPGILNFDSKDSVKITVFSRSQETGTAPVLVGPDTEKVKSCCCFNQGSMSIGFQADRSVVGRNDRLGLIVVAQNDSKLRVKELRIEIEQKVIWYARGYRATSKRSVAKVTVSGSQLGALGEGADETPYKDRSHTAVATEAQAHLQELLASGAGVRHEVVVPQEKCSDSLQAGNITVHHSLDVSLKTSSFATNPELSMPLVVQRVSTGAAGGAGASIVAIPVVTATVMPLDAQGNPTPVQVPSDLVKFEMEEGVPDPSAPLSDV